MDNSIYKKCTECGQTKHISEFSKSYPNRCKSSETLAQWSISGADALIAELKKGGKG